MDWKGLVMYVLGAEEERRKLIYNVSHLDTRKRTLEDRLEELMSTRPWEDKNRNFFSRAWGYTDYISHRRSEDKTQKSLAEAEEQLKPVRIELRALEANLTQEAREYMLRNSGFDEAYDAARQQHLHVNNLIYRTISLHKHAEDALKGVIKANENYESSQKPNWSRDWWLKWGGGYLRGVKKNVDSLTQYDVLVEQISAYLPNEAHALENGIKLARMLDLDHIEKLSKPITHLTGLEKDITKAKKGLQKTQDRYRRMKRRQITHLLTRIRDGAF